MRVCVCRTDRVTLVDTYQYDDSSANDTFQREPYCVKFYTHHAGATPRVASNTNKSVDRK